VLNNANKKLSNDQNKQVVINEERKLVT